MENTKNLNSSVFTIEKQSLETKTKQKTQVTTRTGWCKNYKKVNSVNQRNKDNAV